MTNDQSPDALRQQLATFRSNLNTLLLQAAQYGGELFAPLPLVNQLAAQRDSIKQLEEVLRTAPVSSNQNAHAERLRAEIAKLEATLTALDGIPEAQQPLRERIAARQRELDVAERGGFYVTGDYVAGDKVGGDKVAGNKTVNHGPVVHGPVSAKRDVNVGTDLHVTNSDEPPADA